MVSHTTPIYHRHTDTPALVHYFERVRELEVDADLRELVGDRVLARELLEDAPSFLHSFLRVDVVGVERVKRVDAGALSEPVRVEDVRARRGQVRHHAGEATGHTRHARHAAAHAALLHHLHHLLHIGHAAHAAHAAHGAHEVGHLLLLLARLREPRDVERVRVVALAGDILLGATAALAHGFLPLFLCAVSCWVFPCLSCQKYVELACCNAVFFLCPQAPHLPRP